MFGWGKRRAEGIGGGEFDTWRIEKEGSERRERKRLETDLNLITDFAGRRERIEIRISSFWVTCRIDCGNAAVWGTEGVVLRAVESIPGKL